MLIFFSKLSLKICLYPYAYFSAIFIKILRLRRNYLSYQDFFQSEPRQYAYQFGQYVYFFLITSLGYAYKWYAYKKNMYQGELNCKNGANEVAKL